MNSTVTTTTVNSNCKLTNNWRVRPAVVQDRSIIADFCKSYYKFKLNPRPLIFEEITQDKLLDSDVQHHFKRIILLEERNSDEANYKPVGFLAWEPNSKPDTVHLISFYVSCYSRGKGLSKQLMHKFFELSRQFGYFFITCELEETDYTGINYAVSLGYQQIEQYDASTLYRKDLYA